VDRILTGLLVRLYVSGEWGFSAVVYALLAVVALVSPDRSCDWAARYEAWR